MFIYNLGIRFYGLFLWLASLFNPKAKKWVDGRVNWESQLPEVKNKKVVWFHCASLGEFEQGRPVIEEWKKRFPTNFILVTFFSPSGYEIQKNYSHADHIMYLPLDTPKNAKNFITYFQPTTVFFVKYEFWLNYIFSAKKANANLFSLSALFRPNQRFFKWYGKIFRNALHHFDYFFVQNQASQQLLNSIGIQNAKITGDTRYDRIFDRIAEQKENELIKNWLGDEKVFVIGSSWPSDEAIILPIINNQNWIKKVIIAPHNVDKKHVKQLTNGLKKAYSCYTEVNSEIPKESQILVLDCIGVLADAYKYGEFAYVGGAFGTGLHNILEPAGFGLPVVFGPKFSKFPEAYDFIERGIGFSVESQTELSSKINHIKQYLEELKSNVLDFTNQQKGARNKVLEVLEQQFQLSE